MDDKPVRRISPPSINITPLIDVLLVLLIIFMVASPLRPHQFKALVPAPPDNRAVDPNPKTLVVTVDIDRTLKLNAVTDMGTVDDMSKLTQRLTDVFAQRTRNRVFRDDLVARSDLSDSQRIEKTVFVKAPRALSYGELARVIDGLKGSGAEPIGLQLDDLK
jgi:biopolymer transport protein TolR